METNDNVVERNIDPSRFEFVNDQERLHDAKFETKPIGYFKDAMIRFRKNKGSVIGGVIILLLVIYALLVPLFSSNVAKNISEKYYAKMGPRLTWAYNIGVNGSQNKDYNENLLLNYVAMGWGAEYHYDETTGQETFPDLKQAKKSYYQPLIKTTGHVVKSQGGLDKDVYYANVDEYLAVGFINMQMSVEEYNKILNWQKEKNIQILYPLIDTSHPDYLGVEESNKIAGNYWYRVSKQRTSKGAPLDESGNIMKYGDENLHFIDIFLRNVDGKPVFYKLVGSGDETTASRMVRVLYYNYYRFLYNTEPNYVFGTDSNGFDLSYRMATGMRISFILSVFVSVINFVIGAIYGAIEGYYGGTTDLVMERISDILADIPFVVVATLFNLHLAKKVGPFVSLLFAFVMTGWIGTASRVRSQFYRFKNSEYVLAARTLGARDARIMWKHVFPNTLGTIITSSVLVIPSVIFSESMLSYLNIISLGTRTTTSLGTLLSEASGLWTQSPHLMIFPAIVISLLMICFNLFGNGLRDAFNPTLRGADE